MCGISGFLGEPKGSAEDVLRVAAAMSECLRHRGPDDVGLWADAEAGVGFGFRRLAIIDLTEQGHQPMLSDSGRYVIELNGEIYNFPSLREGLEREGHRFRGHSDTEVALAVIERVGLARALEQFNGMFAIALWDRAERRLSLARDRFGEKPLYYGWSGPTFVFASELKALRRHPDFRADIDRDALAAYFRFMYVPSPASIYRGIRKLPPGHFLCLRATDVGTDGRPIPFWSAAEAARRGLADPFTGSEAEAVARLDTLLRDTVRMRMVADVPLGAFLSGGIDSSTVVALMQAQQSRPVRTFTIGFEEAAYNEARDAKAVAARLGTDHTELYVTPADARSVIERLPRLYDEPFADASQIPTFLVASLARRQVTVALSGDGGDELFGGYNRYAWAGRIAGTVRFLPGFLRRAAGQGLSAVPPDVWDRVFSVTGSVLPRRWRIRTPGEKVHKLGAMLAVDEPSEMYQVLVSTWADPLVVGSGTAGRPPALNSSPSIGGDFRQWMMYQDTVTYLPDDILAKVDRASMGVSLEARVPLLDPDVYEFAWRLPLSLKVRGGRGKWILRRVLERYLSPALFERPKMGFALPVGGWLRAPLRDWASDLLDETRLRREGFLRPEPIQSIWQAHLRGHADWQYRLWAVLMFQSWLMEHHGASNH